MAKISRRGFFKRAAVMGAIPLVATAQEHKEAPTLKFVHITDSHMDLSDSDSVEAMKLMVRFMNTNYKDLDFVLFGGDNFNNNVPGNKDAMVFKEIIEQLPCPAYVVRGNKESSPAKDQSIDLSEFKKMFLDHEEMHVVGKDWKIEQKGYLLLGLDSCIEGQNNGLYTQETIAFADKALREGKPTIILNHHPYTNYWGGTEKKDLHKYVLNNTQEVQDLLFKYDNLILTLSGHKHIDSVTQINQAKVIVTRGFIRPLDLDMFPMRYVEITGSKIQEKMIYTA